jgi:hypothetical protein
MSNVTSDYASKAMFGVLNEAAVNQSRRERTLYSVTAASAQHQFIVLMLMYKELRVYD